MAEERIHRAVSADGTEIAGRVSGSGPPLVFVHGDFETGDTAWGELLPHLTRHFRCYAMNRRGRGLSATSDALSTERLVQDVVAFTESIGEPVGLVGESSGGPLVLGAAARSAAVSAVAAYEPVVYEAWTGEEEATFWDLVEEVDGLAAQGRPVAGMRAFAAWVGNDDELAAIAGEPEALVALAENVPIQIREFKQLRTPEGPSTTGPSQLREVGGPVLLLRGTKSRIGDYVDRGISHIAAHVQDVSRREIPGAGHFGPVLAPEPIAEELIRFFSASERKRHGAA